MGLKMLLLNLNSVAGDRYQNSGRLDGLFSKQNIQIGETNRFSVGSTRISF